MVMARRRAASSAGEAATMGRALAQIGFAALLLLLLLSPLCPLPSSSAGRGASAPRRLMRALTSIIVSILFVSESVCR